VQTTLCFPSSAWVGADIKQEDYFFQFSGQARSEILNLLEYLQAQPLASLDLRSHDLPFCRELMSSVKNALDYGVGFAILDKLPLDILSEEEAEKAFLS